MVAMLIWSWSFDHLIGQTTLSSTINIEQKRPQNFCNGALWVSRVSTPSTMTTCHSVMSCWIRGSCKRSVIVVCLSVFSVERGSLYTYGCTLRCQGDNSDCFGEYAVGVCRKCQVGATRLTGKADVWYRWRRRASEGVRWSV